jgi:hypothetical protein
MRVRKLEDCELSQTDPKKFSRFGFEPSDPESNQQMRNACLAKQPLGNM